VSRRYRVTGYASSVHGVTGRTIEQDTITCAHCNALVFLHDDSGKRLAAEKIGGLCATCLKPICPKCAGHPCRPFERALARAEGRDRMLRQILGG
jgi:hypothetical protein